MHRSFRGPLATFGLALCLSCGEDDATIGEPFMGGDGADGGGGRAEADGGTRDAGAPPADLGTGAAPPPAMAEGCPVTRPGGTGREPGGAIPVCCTPGPADRQLIDQVFNLLNAHRAANGLPALAYDMKLEQAMQGHCRHMAIHTFFSHGSPEPVVASLTARAALCGTNAQGENIAYNQRTAEQVMASWKSSAGHNANMLSRSYRRVGIGQYQWRWGQIFGR